MTGIIQEGVREARAKYESNGRPLAHDASFVLDFARYYMLGINAWPVRRARLVLILLDIMAGINQGVSARERRVNSRPLAHDMPFARASYLPLLDDKRKQNERRRRSFSRLWECNEKIHWDDGSGVHNKTLFRASPFSLVCCMKLIFIFFSSFRSARYEDQYIIRFYKDKLHSMPCQNQVRCVTLCVKLYLSPLVHYQARTFLKKVRDVVR